MPCWLRACRSRFCRLSLGMDCIPKGDEYAGSRTSVRSWRVRNDFQPSALGASLRTATGVLSYLDESGPPKADD
jgi:hypothetical protein